MSQWKKSKTKSDSGYNLLYKAQIADNSAQEWAHSTLLFLTNCTHRNHDQNDKNYLILKITEQLMQSVLQNPHTYYGFNKAGFNMSTQKLRPVCISVQYSPCSITPHLGFFFYILLLKRLKIKSARNKRLPIQKHTACNVCVWYQWNSVTAAQLYPNRSHHLENRRHGVSTDTVTHPGLAESSLSDF